MRKPSLKKISFLIIISLTVVFAGAMLLITYLPRSTDLRAVDDAAVTIEDTATTVTVLTNDTDADMTTVTITAYSQPDHGYVIKYANGLRYTPYTDYHGSDTFTYTLTNAAGDTSTATVTITVTADNDKPHAFDDVIGTVADAAVTIDVVANDTDVDGDDVTIDSYTHPEHGTVTITGDNRILYTPDPGYVGDDEFTYDIVDPDGLSDRATVTVHVTAAD